MLKQPADLYVFCKYYQIPILKTLASQLFIRLVSQSD